MTRKRFWSLISSLVSLLLAAIIAVQVVRIWSILTSGLRLRNKALALVGRSELDVIHELGPPRFVVHAATLGVRTVEYPWKGMTLRPVPTYPVRNKVLLYSAASTGVYLYIDPHGKVEHVAVAST